MVFTFHGSHGLKKGDEIRLPDSNRVFYVGRILSATSFTLLLYPPMRLKTKLLITLFVIIVLTLFLLGG